MIDLKAMYRKVHAYFRQSAKSVRVTTRSEANICSLPYFKKRLFIERLRAERLDSRCCVLVFDMRTWLDFRQCDGTSNELRSTFLTAISSVIRQTDAVCLHKSMMLVLLADTDLLYSVNVRERIADKIGTTFGRGGWAKHPIDARVVEFPHLCKKRDIPNTAEDDRASGDKVVFAVSHRYHFMNTCSYTVASSGLGLGASVTLPLPLLFDLDFGGLLLQSEQLLKRVVDIVGAIVCLFLTWPLMLLIAACIKCDSPGPVLFKQIRLGHRARPFTFVKFRTMAENCDETIHRQYVEKLIIARARPLVLSKQTKPLYKLDNDSRVTRFGKFLRTTSLDELPQLFNVLKGEMSLVGPRPPIPYEVQCYDTWHWQRLEAIPGITGLWQVKGRSRTTFSEMVRLDIQYIRNWSLWLDLRIIMQTFGVVISRDGAL